jgi:hypothetical protein
MRSSGHRFEDCCSAGVVLALDEQLVSSRWALPLARWSTPPHRGWILHSTWRETSGRLMCLSTEALAL